MSARNSVSFVNGTSALKMPRFVEEEDQAKIIVFPSRQAQIQDFPHDEAAREDERPALEAKASEVAKRIQRVLESSEMYCSLRLESMSGCPYNLFSRESIVALAAGSSLVGIIALVLSTL